MPTDRASYAGMLPPDAFNQRNRIAQTMMNIGSPPPQVGMPQGGMPPGMMRAPSPLKSLMGMEDAGPSSFMGGRGPPMAPPQAPAPPPPTMGGSAGPMPLQPSTAPPVDPSSLFAPPPAVPGQAPPQFAKPPVY